MDFEIRDYQTMQNSIADLCRMLDELGVPADSVFDCRLVANELLGNALRHAKALAKLCGRVEGGFVELTVFSSKTFTPPKTSVCSDVYAEHGRGLFLVDSVCAERSTTPDGGISVKIRIK